MVPNFKGLIHAGNRRRLNALTVEEVLKLWEYWLASPDKQSKYARAVGHATSEVSALLAGYISNVIPAMMQAFNEKIFIVLRYDEADIDKLLQPECWFIVVRAFQIRLIIAVRAFHIYLIIVVYKVKFCVFTEVLLFLHNKYKTLMDTSVLLEILRDQREELDSLHSQSFCKRREEDMVKLESKKAQVVIGVRRSGKSTLCFNVLNKAQVKFAYVNFDDERLVRLSADDLNDVLKCLYQIYGDFTHLFLDEAQNIEGWHLFVNRLLRHGMKVIITGSNAKLLSSELSTYLTGRYNEIELFPFSFREFCEMEEVETTNLSSKTDALLRRAFDKYMETGGFPEIISGEETAEEYIDTLVSNILERDIVQRFKVRYKDAFKSLSNHLMNNAPCEIVYTALQKTFNFKNDKTVENYVGYLYQAYLLKQLRKYSTRSSKRIRNAKCYPIDVSLMNARKDAFAKDNFGWRLESLVFLALCRRYGTGYDVYYHKTDSYEVDFVVCHRVTVVELVQVSYDISSEKTLNRETSALMKAGTSLKCDKLTLVTAFEERVLDVHGQVINVCAAYKWLLI